jgi:hypothetical protein
MIPDYSETESKIIVVATHLLMDGVSAFGYLFMMQKNPDFSKMPKVSSPPSFWVNVLHHIIAPFTIPVIFYRSSNMGGTKSCINSAPEVSLERYVRIIEDVPLADIKAVCKKNDATFNCLINAILSLTLRDYFVNRGSKDTELNFASTFSLKPFARSAEEYEMGNFAVIQMFKF